MYFLFPKEVFLALSKLCARVTGTSSSASSLRDPGLGSHLGCLLDAPSSWAIGQMDSFHTGVFQRGNCRIKVQQFGAKALLGALAKMGRSLPVPPQSPSLPPLQSGKAPATCFCLEGGRKNPIPSTKAHKSFMQSFHLCICNLDLQPECLINRFLFCPPRSSEEYWHVGSAFAHPGWLKGSSPGTLDSNLLSFYCPAHRAMGLKRF